jgi:hypothetical protein
VGDAAMCGRDTAAIIALSTRGDRGAQGATRATFFKKARLASGDTSTPSSDRWAITKFVLFHKLM